ncbi:transcription factor HES-5-like [Syngnathoides biaculeatus]|uniref:transcription factor HES-5-like n=1 Tax=Syngnathoides biaculeatus TaxID=300417 RepID=UPI002ADE1D1E|nr:transcription factor HES-5-like [Syngnathoides biaculeatus]
MAPGISLQDSHPALTHKVRKPRVEKFRRERISSSTLLAPEFPRQRPDSKMEKADVLEMSVWNLGRLRSPLGWLQSSREEKTTEKDLSRL